MFRLEFTTYKIKIYNILKMEKFNNKKMYKECNIKNYDIVRWCNYYE